MKVEQKDPRVPFKLTEDQDRRIYEAAETSDAANALTGEEKIAKVMALCAQAKAVLKGLHDKRMAARLAHWQTRCRLEGCARQPRAGKGAQHKARRRTFVFCPGHAGIRNMITKSDYQSLKVNANLRVIA